MTYRLVLNEFGPQPYSGWNADSLFPGTGAVTRAWEKWQRQLFRGVA